MKQVITVKLETSAEQFASLTQTMRAFNRGCDHVAAVAFTKRQANKIAIQPFVYGSLRADYGLSAQMAIRCIAKAIEAYKRDKSIQPTFDPLGAIVLDNRLMSFKGLSHVSLLTLQGRILVPMRFGAYQAARIDRAKGQADLILRGGTFYLALTIDHVNGEGKSVNERGGYALYRRLKREGYPPGFRVLCHNCNLSLGFFGYCPHSVTETQGLWHHK